METKVFQQQNQIFLQGSVLFDTVAAVQNQALNLLKKFPTEPEYSLDLNGVTTVNSAALGLLVELKKWALAKNKQIHFLNSPQRLIEMAKVCQIADWLEIS